ncbi:hypothetical protein LJR084_001901 [Variovorax sp. LjRoot84]|uniref:hypothetical protein n=1 Tax=Variovorax sp. LjRoot84 TaxID=3342340 RepID=UPI003ECCDEA7
MQEERFAFASFDHPRNIKVGNGRVLWAKEATDTSGIHHQEGWVLPGGVRTRDSDAAHATAVSIDELSRGA